MKSLIFTFLLFSFTTYVHAQNISLGLIDLINNNVISIQNGDSKVLLDGKGNLVNTLPFYAGNAGRIGSDHLEYDLRGRLSQIGDQRIEYDLRNRIVKVGDQDVEYDLRGRVVRIGNQ
ncbi:hypothetical protein, partial [Sphingobacterium sp.]|uniref:hypothetical protein n=1 Tax=Sphingobacterium sp. TaxID=341027 RepID=UPI0028990600